MYIYKILYEKILIYVSYTVYSSLEWTKPVSINSKMAYVDTNILFTSFVRHCGLVESAQTWDGTGCEFDSWQCRI